MLPSMVCFRHTTEPLLGADQRIRSALPHPHIAPCLTRGNGEEARQVLVFSVDAVWFEIDLPELLSMLPEPVRCR